MITKDNIHAGNLPALTNLSVQMSSKYNELAEKLNSLQAASQDGELKDILLVLQDVSQQIRHFFNTIRDILQQPSHSREERFVTHYYYSNFSTISSNSRISERIIDYVLKQTDWLKAHSDRIIQTLKTLNATLMALQIDCQELYLEKYGVELKQNFQFKTFTSEFRKKETYSRKTGIEADFEALGIKKGATREELKQAFREIAKQHHPDLNPDGDMETFIQVEQAYRKLLRWVP